MSGHNHALLDIFPQLFLIYVELISMSISLSISSTSLVKFQCRVNNAIAILTFLSKTTITLLHHYLASTFYIKFLRSMSCPTILSCVVLFHAVIYIQWIIWWNLAKLPKPLIQCWLQQQQPRQKKKHAFGRQRWRIWQQQHQIDQAWKPQWQKWSTCFLVERWQDHQKRSTVQFKHFWK